MAKSNLEDKPGVAQSGEVKTLRKPVLDKVARWDLKEEPDLHEAAKWNLEEKPVARKVAKSNL